MSQGELIVEVQSGVTDRPSVSLRPGEPLEPLSIGRNAFWQVLADGVSSVQAFIYFDGDAVFVASADPANPAVAAGALVGEDWTEIYPPCEIRLGHAVLLLRAAASVTVHASQHGYSQRNGSSSGTERPAEMDFDEGEFSTAKVDGHHLESELRRRKPRISVPQDDEPTRMADPPTAVAPVAQRKSRRKPKIRVPKAEEATLYRPIEEPATVPWRGTDLTDPMPQPQPVHQVPTEPGPFPAVVNPRVGAGAPAASPGFVPPGVGQAPPWIVQPPAPIGAGQPMAMQPPMPTASSPDKTSAGQTSRMAAQGRNPTVAKLLEAWKQASFPQKAILCLLPVAFVSVFLMFGGDDADARKKPKPQPSAIVSSSAAPTASAPGTESATADTAPPPSSAGASASTAKLPPAATTPNAAVDKGPHPTSGKGAPPRSLERQASDAVAAGSFSEALKVYEQLAAQHPEMPVYKEAVRILKGKMGDAK